MANSTNATLPVDDSYNQILMKLLSSTGLVLMIVNVVTNTCNIVVFTRPRFRKTSAGFYFTTLAVFDLAQTFMIFQLYVRVYDFSLDNISPFMCKFNNYLGATLPLLPAWTMVVIAFERCISARLVSSARFLNNKQTQCSVVGLMVLLLMTLNVALFKMLPVKQTNEAFTCVDGPGDYVVAQDTNFNCIITTAFLPFALMTAANVLTVRSMMSSKKKVYSGNTDKETRFAVTIISLNCMFFVFYVPMCITMITLMCEDTLTSIKSNHDLVNLILTIMKYCRHSHSCIQFFIYVAVNRIYRKELVLMIVAIAPCMKGLSRVLETSSTTTNQHLTKHSDDVQKE